MTTDPQCVYARAVSAWRATRGLNDPEVFAFTFSSWEEADLTNVEGLADTWAECNARFPRQKQVLWSALGAPLTESPPTGSSSIVVNATYKPRNPCPGLGTVSITHDFLPSGEMRPTGSSDLAEMQQKKLLTYR
jgi:hypothetical protein